MARPNAKPVVSLDVDVCNYESVIERIAEMTEEDFGSYVCVSTVHMVMEGHDDPAYGDTVNSADLVVPDGMPLVWMQKLQGADESGRVRGNDLMIRLCAYAEEKGLSVGFYGGMPEVIEGILERARNEFPKLDIVYAFSPPFRSLTAEEDSTVVKEIMEKKPDILFVGLGCPKQEIWMADHKSKLDAVMLGVGASFDFYAGNIKEAPDWLQKLGLEWLFRLTQEPKRLWRRYLILNPRFVVLAVSQLLRRGTTAKSKSE
ncbi:MAG: WecB/TagA/CpsF family glycosyltransferase [Pyrinomonadaceae bacterium]|nr:WecB/TagA/CpsF family glycosyltransferase [Pyrinomonadaceae bacterium]